MLVPRMFGGSTHRELCVRGIQWSVKRRSSGQSAGKRRTVIVDTIKDNYKGKDGGEAYEHRKLDDLQLVEGVLSHVVLLLRLFDFHLLEHLLGPDTSYSSITVSRFACSWLVSRDVPIAQVSLDLVLSTEVVLEVGHVFLQVLQTVDEVILVH